VMTVNGQVASTTLGTSGAATVGSTLDVTSDLKVATDKFVVTASSGKATMKGAIEMSMDTATISHTGTSGGLTISSTNNHVAVESVEFSGANIGVSGDTDLIGLASGVMTVNGQVASTTLGTSGAATVGSTLDVTSDLKVATDKFVVTASNGNTAIAGTLSAAGAITVSSVAVTGAASIGGAFATAYAEVTWSAGSTASCPDGKSVCVITMASGTDGSYTVVYGGSPVTGLMVFVRNDSGVDTADTAFGTDKTILKNKGALFVYSGTVWMKIL